MKRFILIFTIVFMITMLTSCHATYYNPKEFKNISKELKIEYKFISKAEMYCASDPTVLSISFDIKNIPDNSNEIYESIVIILTEYFLSEEFDQFMNKTNMAYNHEEFQIKISFYYEERTYGQYTSYKKINYTEWQTGDFDENGTFVKRTFTISNDEEE